MTGSRLWGSRRVQDEPAGGGVAEPDRPVLRAGGQDLAVGREGDWLEVVRRKLRAGRRSPRPATIASSSMVRSSRPVATSQIRMVASPPPAEARVLPSGENASSPAVLSRGGRGGSGSASRRRRPRA